MSNLCQYLFVCDLYSFDNEVCRKHCDRRERECIAYTDLLTNGYKSMHYVQLPARKKEKVKPSISGWCFEGDI